MLDRRRSCAWRWCNFSLVSVVVKVVSGDMLRLLLSSFYPTLVRLSKRFLVLRLHPVSHRYLLSSLFVVTQVPHLIQRLI